MINLGISEALEVMEQLAVRAGGGLHRAAVDTLKAQVALLSNYRGTCQECGRDDVLLDYIGTYDGMETVCLLDKQECERLAHERRVREGEEHRARVAAGDPMAILADTLGRSMLNMARKPPTDFKPGMAIQFVTSNITVAGDELDAAQGGTDDPDRG